MPQNENSFNPLHIKDYSPGDVLYMENVIPLLLGDNNWSTPAKFFQLLDGERGIVDGIHDHNHDYLGFVIAGTGQTQYLCYVENDGARTENEDWDAMRVFRIEYRFEGTHEDGITNDSLRLEMISPSPALIEDIKQLYDDHVREILNTASEQDETDESPSPTLTDTHS